MNKMVECGVMSSLSLLLCLLLPLIHCNFVARTEDDLYYFGGSKRLDYRSNIKFCEDIGGVVPSVHSEQDISYVTTIVTEGECVWVAGQNIGINGSYEWEDGSDFDYAPWFDKEPKCESDCCAICIGTQETKADHNKFKTSECSQSDNVQVCRINMSIPESRERLLESWQKKLTESERSTLSAYFFMGFLKDMSNLDEKITMDEKELEIRMAQMTASLEQVKITVKRKNEENEKRMREMGRQIDENTALLMSRIAVVNDSLWESMTAFDHETGVRMEQLSRAISEAVEVTEAQIRESANTTAGMVRELKDKVSHSITKLDDKVNRYRSAVNSSLEQSFLTLSDMVSQVESNLSQQITAIDVKVDNYTDTFDSQLQRKDGQESVELLKLQLEKYDLLMKQQNETLWSVVSGLQTEVQQLKAELAVTQAPPTTTTTTSAAEATLSKRGRYDWRKWIPRFVRS